MYQKIRHGVYDLIRDDDENNLAANIFDGVIITLIVLNVIAVIADTFPLQERTRLWLSRLETVSVIIFTVEYLLRLWTSDLMRPELRPGAARLRYAVSFMALIDLLAILPFYLPFLISIDLRILRMLRIVRLLRVFKVNRYTHAISTIGAVFRRKRGQLLSSVFVCLLLMIVASVLMYDVEHQAQPDEFANALSALWWAVSTLTTVGYGDICPVTVLGKLLSAVIALLGIGLVAVPTGIISSGFMEQIRAEEAGESDEKHYCPYCGHKLDQ